MSPRGAVEQADSLVAGAMKRLAEIFADERAKLEGQWDRGEAYRPRISGLRYAAIGYFSAAFFRYRRHRLAHPALMSVGGQLREFRRQAEPAGPVLRN